VIDLAVRSGLRAIAITDHDTLDALAATEEPAAVAFGFPARFFARLHATYSRPLR
jgi:predicted metal-dependent phosphoesterase TrpH